MISVGVSADARGYAAAVVAAGSVLSATSRPVSALTDPKGAVGCVAEALAVAGIAPDDVDRVVATAAADLPHDGADIVGPHVAQAALLRAIGLPDTVVVVLDDSETGRMSIFFLNELAPGLQAEGTIVPALGTLASVARLLGLPATQPIAALESIASPDSGGQHTVAPASGHTLALDESSVIALVDHATAHSPVPLNATDTPHLRTQQMRSAVATGVLEGLARTIACAAGRTADGCGAPVAYSGAAFASAAFAARVRRHLAGTVAPAVDATGQALGAALLPHEHVRTITTLAFGSEFSEEQIKATLDNCRLEYVYEPHWPRLFSRTSQLLETGALVGWFQGRADVGGASLGSRSILCDPSNRYSRENLNVFLLNRPAQAPLALSLLTETTGHAPLRFAYGLASEVTEHADKLVSAIDRFGRLLYHVPDPQTMPAIHALLTTHRSRTNVPGLLNVPMATSGGLTATPRDAIREIFGSTADALVIGRFIIAKDYWLLRR
jgi:hypothetical protein